MAKPNKKMSESELTSQVQMEMQQSVAYIDGELSYQRQIALQYYNGETVGDLAILDDNRSKVVSRDVSDTVEWILPALLKIFTAGDDVVRFEPQGPEDEEQAKQATEYCNWILMRDNPGFVIIYTLIKDALIQKNGIAKVWWEVKETNETHTVEGLDDDAYNILLDDPDVEIISHSQTEPPDLSAGVGPVEAGAASLAPGPLITHDVEYRKKKEAGKTCIENVPPEEFLISRRAKTIQDAIYVGHRTRKTLSDLIAEGYDKTQVEELQGDDALIDFNMEQVIRYENDLPDDEPEEHTGQNRQVWIEESYIRIDYDGDGIAEMRRVVTANQGKTLLKRDGKPVNEKWEGLRPFISLTPIIQPHKFFGLSIADIIMDIQTIKSVLMRQTLDNLYLTNNPRNEVSSWVNMDDYLDSRVGGAIRIQEGAPEMQHVKPLTVPFVAGQSLNVLEYLDEVKSNRTGVTAYNQGIDANSLNKMLDIHTDIPMADGTFKILRDVQDGDRLIGASGYPVTVTKAHEIHDPERAYRMTFASGEEIVAGGEHLWTVQTQGDKTAGKSRVLDTDAVYARFNKFGENIYIPRVQRPMSGENIDLPLDPYVLGVWLGDGHGWAPRVTTADAEIRDTLQGWADNHACRVSIDTHQNSGLATTYSISGVEVMERSDVGQFQRNESSLYRILADQGLLKGDRLPEANCKHIPEIYFLASYDQRLELLRGLMDTDGCHHSGALCVFSQKEGRLFSDVMRLVESLGGWPSFSEVDPGPLARDGVTYLNMTFHLFDNPFKLSKKAAKWRAPIKNAVTQPIVSIEPVDIRPMRCLTVDAEDGLFCVGHRWTVTHNTASGITQIMTAAQQRIELIARICAETGMTELFRLILYTVTKYQQKERVIRLRGEWVPMDPQNWDTEFDTTINVGLGTGNKDQMLMHLNNIMGMQVKALEMQGGAEGPLVRLENIYNTAAKIVENSGLKSAELYFTDPAQNPMPPKQPQPDPEMIKIQQQGQIDQAKLQLETQKAVAQLELEKQKQAAEFELKKQQMEFDQQLKMAQFQQSAQVASIKAQPAQNIIMGAEGALASLSNEVDKVQGPIQQVAEMITQLAQAQNEVNQRQDQQIQQLAAMIQAPRNKTAIPQRGPDGKIASVQIVEGTLQ
jgi:hypothetical protein